MKLACPYVARSGAGRRISASVFNEGVSVPADAWAREVKANPALASSDHKEASEAKRKSILTGELKKYRQR